MVAVTTKRLTSFFVPGMPVAQGSKVAMLHAQTKRPIVMENRSSRERLVIWRAAIRLAAHAATEGRLDYVGPVELVANFAFARLKSHLKKNGALRKGKSVAHTMRPDLSKLLRAIEDALTDAGVWCDDSQVVAVTATKRYGPEPGVSITVMAWEERHEL